MLRLTVRLVSIGFLAALGLLFAVSPLLSEGPAKKDGEKPPTTPSGGPISFTIQGTLTAVPTGAKPIKPPVPAAPGKTPLSPKRTTVSIDKTGIATFTHTFVRTDTDSKLGSLPFRAVDFDDALRSLTVSSDPKALATGGAPPLLQVLQGRKDAIASSKALQAVRLMDLLGSLRGQAVEVSDGSPTPKKGQLLLIDTSSALSNPKDTPTPTTPAASNQSAGKTLVLWSKDSGIVVVPLTTATVIKFSDPGITGQVQQALDDLGRGDAQTTRTLEVKLPKGKSAVEYSHRLTGFDTQYTLTLGPKPPALSARVTVQNSTAQPWADVVLSLTGLPWPTPKPVATVSLNADRTATFTVVPPADSGLSIKGDSLTYTNQQTSPNPRRKFSLASTGKALSTIPGPVTLVEDGQVVGQADVLDFGSRIETGFKAPTYPLMSIHQNKQAPVPPSQIRIANGFLDYRETRKTTLIVVNASTGPKMLTLEATAGWSLGQVSFNGRLFIKKPLDTGRVQGNSVPTLVTMEEYAQRHVALAQWAGLGDFTDSLPDDDSGRILKVVASRQKSMTDALNALDKTRQSLASAIQAIALRQPLFTGGVPGVLLPQLLQDEAAVAGLRQEMDAITATKAALQREFEVFVCGLRVVSPTPPVLGAPKEVPGGGKPMPPS